MTMPRSVAALPADVEIVVGLDEVTSMMVEETIKRAAMRSQMSLVMEDLGSGHHPLAVRSAMGEVCTGLAFMQFLGEIIAQFSLLYSFSTFLHLK